VNDLALERGRVPQSRLGDSSVSDIGPGCAGRNRKRPLRGLSCCSRRTAIAGASDTTSLSAGSGKRG